MHTLTWVFTVREQCQLRPAVQTWRAPWWVFGNHSHLSIHCSIVKADFLPRHWVLQCVYMSKAHSPSALQLKSWPAPSALSIIFVLGLNPFARPFDRECLGEQQCDKKGLCELASTSFSQPTRRQVTPPKHWKTLDSGFPPTRLWRNAGFLPRLACWRFCVVSAFVTLVSDPAWWGSSCPKTESPVHISLGVLPHKREGPSAIGTVLCAVN